MAVHSARQGTQPKSQYLPVYVSMTWQRTKPFELVLLLLSDTHKQGKATLNSLTAFMTRSLLLHRDCICMKSNPCNPWLEKGRPPCPGQR